MNPIAIRFDMLFDAEEYLRSGYCPWTFFAYPTSCAIERGLPPDREACELLARIQQYGIDVAIWQSKITEDTTYFACRYQDIRRLQEALQQLEANGTIEEKFCSKRSDRLFQRLVKPATHYPDA